MFVPMWIMGGVNLVVEKYQAGPVVEMLENEKVAYMFLAPTMVNNSITTSSPLPCFMPFRKTSFFPFPMMKWCT